MHALVTLLLSAHAKVYKGCTSTQEYPYPALKVCQAKIPFMWFHKFQISSMIDEYISEKNYNIQGLKTDNLANYAERDICTRCAIASETF